MYICMCLLVCVQIFKLIVLSVYLVALLYRQSMSKGYNLDVGKQYRPNVQVLVGSQFEEFSNAALSWLQWVQ